MTKKLIPGGFYMTIDGQDFTGKSTQALLLEKKLSEEFEVCRTREPGGTQTGERIRDLLLDPRSHDIDYIGEILIYNSARSVLFANVVLPSLFLGKIVLSERGEDATKAYQGYGAGQDIEMISRINNIATRGRKPDLSFIFDMPLEERLRRKGKTLDRIERRDIDYQEKVSEGFRKIAQDNQERCVLVHAERGSIEELHEAIYNTTKERIDRKLANQ